MKPHKHCELIKLWADGAEIQVKNGDAWEDCVLDPFPVAFYVYEWINPSDGIVFRSFRHDEHHMGRDPDRTIAVPAPYTCAAPDLLKALETIAEYWNRDTNHGAMEDACWYAINTAEAAIAKARGEQT